jgi:hypothetical protein
VVTRVRDSCGIGSVFVPNAGPVPFFEVAVIEAS